MKKLITVALILLLCASAAFAGGVENKNNFSAGYLRTLSKNAETEKADATFYNPAGTAFMADGLHIAIDNQFVTKNYTSDFGTSGKIEDKTPVLLYPSASLVWKMTNLSVFANFGVVAGGGTLEYEQLPAFLGGGDFKVSTMTFGETIGASYKFFDMISVSAAVKLAHGSFSQETSPKTELERELSLGWVAGVHVRPIENLDIGIQYQSQINMKQKNKESGSEVADYHLPAMIGAGVGYQISEPFSTSLSFNYYFNEDAGSDYDNTWEIGLSAQYDILKILGVSLGVLYTDAGHNDKVNNILSSVLDSVAVGGGVELRFFEDLKFDISVMNVFYFDDEFKGVDLSKDVFTLGIGASYRLF